MQPETFEQIWKDVLVYAPATPAPMAQKLVRDAYRSVQRRFRLSGTRADSGWVIPATYSTGTATLTQGSTAVTGGGTTWTSAMEGRQFFVGGKAPYYTVSAVGSATTLTLDRVWAGASGAASSYAIQKVLVTPETDFLFLSSVVDVDNNWRLRLDVTQETLDGWDAQRSSSGTPWVVSTAAFSSAGYPRFELWPRPPTTEKYYPYRYYRQLELSASTDRPVYPVTGEVLKQFALAELAKWPGTRDAPNPYFSPDLFKLHKIDFMDELDKVHKSDQEIRQTDLSYGDPWERLPFAPIDSKFIQSHALV